MSLALHTETSNESLFPSEFCLRIKTFGKFASSWRYGARGWEEGGAAGEQVFKYRTGESGGTADPGAAVHLPSPLTSREQVRYRACTLLLFHLNAVELQ